MSYQVLARKWRPRDFATTIGQDHVVRALQHALEHQRLHHAYLFTGTRGVGKTTLARILAKALNCTGADGQGDITATPCGVCEACTAIDAGRYIDYIEIDAASNRSVDEMTALLERALYAPSSARFKVYMIDEVHQLSNHAFNAMLKTLEEPPAHVKFILATTDPQKVPVTVLSRCLQFNLKQMTPAAVAAQMDTILRAEGLGSEPAALQLLAQAARGSMRDGLSLLDQAIAYAAGPVTLDAVRAMLGAIDQDTLAALLRALAARDGARLLALADDMATRSVSFGQALRDLASLLHRVALTQQVTAAAGDGPDAPLLRELAAQFAADEVQLLYQVAVHGRNDMALAPDEYAGFTMALMRMLAFAPLPVAPPSARAAALQAPRPPSTSVPVARAAPAVARPSGAAVAAAASKPAPARAVPAQAPRAAEVSAREPEPPVQAAPAPLVFDGNWPALVARLPVQGFVRELAARSELIAVEGRQLQLRVPLRTLLEGGNLDKLQAAVIQALGQSIRLAAEVGDIAGPTAAALADAAHAERQRRAEAAVYADPVVRELIDQFGASVDPASIRPRDA